MMAIAERINSLSDPVAQQLLCQCCASPKWIERMLARRPFADDGMVAATATEVWWSLDRDQWFASFAAHPKIGDLASLRAKYANSARWASSEQAGAALASEATLRDLASYNQQYETRFGYIFIVCATGKSADEMLSLLKLRLKNDTVAELRIAAAEQIKITLLRLEKLAV